MSIMYCERHNLRWDSDFKEACPRCEDEPEPAEAIVKFLVPKYDWSWMRFWHPKMPFVWPIRRVTRKQLEKIFK